MLLSEAEAFKKGCLDDKFVVLLEPLMVSNLKGFKLREAMWRRLIKNKTM
jgi:hypothetical protein